MLRILLFLKSFAPFSLFCSISGTLSAMYIQVRLLKGFPEPLWYRVPDDWLTAPSVGTLVRVPLKERLISALVTHTCAQKPDVPFTIRPAYAYEPFPADQHYFAFIQKLSMYHQITPVQFVQRLHQFVRQKQKSETRTQGKTDARQTTCPDVTLTPEQQKIVDFLLPKISQPTYTPTLLHGVTSSGKTEVYKKLLEHAHAHGKTSLLLLPEVTLAVQFEQRLRTQLPADMPLFGFHSASSTPHKRALWQAACHGTPCVIIGVHLPVLLPLSNLGLIIVDEEHETGYQEKKHPKINSKDTAIWRAHQYRIPIVLGSATPSLASLHNVKTKGWHFFELKKRFAGAFPQVQTVLLPQDKRRPSFWISTTLQHAITQQLERKQQTIIFLNRRGFSFFVQCKRCQFVVMCPNCSVSLTMHADKTLRCHYCGSTAEYPHVCPKCKAVRFLNKGIGTQQLVSILEKMFPQARIGRADLDTTVNKKHWQETLGSFEREELDILVGTQTITKGYHFPNVTLVGIIWADANLHFPMYNASERALQQLIQVAGRAGRQHPESRVIVQSMSEHPIFEYVNEQKYPQFYAHEIRTRQQVQYPPFVRLIEVEVRHTDEETVDHDAKKIAHWLQEHAPKGTRILGPAQPPVHKIKNVFMRTIYIKTHNIGTLIKLYGQIDTLQLASTAFFTPNPVT